MNTILRPAREVTVRGEYDVVVCGGGLGGIAAAVAAGRTGARTLLVERNSFLGGVATAGMCCSIFNCYFAGGDERTLGTSGIAVEVADALAEATGYGVKWRNHKGHIIYDIERAKLVLQELVEGSGAEVLLQTPSVDAVVDNGLVQGVVVETKRGPEAFLGHVIVDATGDADIAARGGAAVKVRESGVHSLCFRLGNVDVDRFVDYFRSNREQFPERMDVDWSLDEALAQYDECRTFLFPHGGGMQMDAFRRAKASGELPARVGVHDTTDACQMHALGAFGVVHVITGFSHFDGLDSERISRSIADGRRMASVVAKVYRAHIPGFERAFLVGTAANLGVRTSRYLDGEFVFERSMLASGTRQPDSVGRLVGFDHIVKHHGHGAWSSQVCHEVPSDLPFRCLLPRGIDGLIVGAGRSVSAADPSLLRVMAHTMVVGQAAGTAAAVAGKDGVTPREVEILTVQDELRRQGVAL